MQKQWLEIGMLLAQDPKLLLVDEPVAGMTDAETAQTAELLREIAVDHSVVVVEHDMSFVRDMLDKPEDHTIVHTIISMARALGLRTLAEGVEQRAQADALLALGCDQMQGWYRGPAVPGDEFAARWLTG